jgi:hypothetical protein
MHEKAVISNVANAGTLICEHLKAVCYSDKQFSEANFETHITGLAFVRFFLMHSGRAVTYPHIVEAVENIYLNILSSPPAFLRLALIGKK